LIKVNKTEKENLLEKLRFIPKEELVNVIKTLYKDDKILNLILKKEFHIKSLSPFKKLDKLDADKLIKIIFLVETLPKELIENLFVEYYYTKYPSIFLSQLIQPDWIDYAEFKEIFAKHIVYYSKNKLEIEEAASFKDLRLIDEPIIDKDIIEIMITYQQRIDYISPDTKEPAHIYGLETGLVWISKKQNSVITKVNQYKIHKSIMLILKDILKCNFRTFSLNQRIVDELFGLESLRSGNYKHPNPKPDQVASKSLRDAHLMRKQEAIETNRSYDRSSSYHKIKGFKANHEISLRLNSKLGKISIQSNIKKSELRNWVHKIFKNIIEKMNIFKDEDFKSFINNYNLNEIRALDEIKFKTSKELVRNIFIGINTILKSGAPEIQINFPLKKIISNLREFITQPLFSPICHECGSNQIICGDCSNSQLVFKYEKGKMGVFCSKCNVEIENLQAQLLCENNHPIEGDLEENITILLNTDFNQLIFNLIQEFSLDIPFHIEDLIMIENGTLKILKTDYKYVYLFNELPSFKKIPPLTMIDENVKRQQEKNLNDLQEKCNNYSAHNCRKCLRIPSGHCLQRVIAYFTEADLHAHSPIEFGDISFDQNLNGELVNIISIVKSYNAAPKRGHIYTLSKNSGLLSQVLDSIFDSRIQFLAIITGADIEPRLKETIKRLILWQRKRIVFFGRNELIRILSQYF